MYLDHSKLDFDKDGRPEIPELMLQTLGGRTIGVLTNVSELRFDIKFSEPSEISFSIASHSDGAPTPFYDDVSSYKVIYTEHYGIYVISAPSTTADGIGETKTVTGYSIEKTLDTKKFFLEEGTFNFWNPATPDDTILGRVLELASGWKVGYVSPSLIGKYRTFDSYDDLLLSFLYNTAPEKYRCVFSFDPYKKTIDVYDADEEIEVLPIYLDFENLLNEVKVDEVTDELVTAMRPYGADELDIRSVNPIGTNWIYDLSYFISNGDIPPALSKKWQDWQTTIRRRQAYYNGLVCLRSSASAELIAEQAALVELQNELKDLTNQQSVTVQAIALEEKSGSSSQQSKLDEINSKIDTKKKEVSAKEADIASIKERISGTGDDSYDSRIKAVTDELAIRNFFTDEEYLELSSYFIEEDMTEETFVASDYNSAISGASYQLGDTELKIESSSVQEVDISESYANKKLFTFRGGSFSIFGKQTVTGDVVRGTLERQNTGRFVFSLYAGSIKTSGSSAESGTITISGDDSSFTSDISAKTEDGITTMEGTHITVESSSPSMYLTANVSDYQRCSVQMELFDYAEEVLKDKATPTYEFSVESANFLFAKEFSRFRDKLALGKGVYLRVSDDEVIRPAIIEMEVDFEDLSSFSLVFSNRFKRHDNVNTLKDMVESSYSSSRKFDTSRYLYNKTSSQTSVVTRFINDSLDAAKNTILAAKDQSVIIDGTGIQIGGASKDKIRIVNNMIAMSDDDWQHAKVAIGRFTSDEVGEYWGVNADVIGGKLIIGNDLVLENETDEGVMQFKVDSTGAWLNNAVFVLQRDGGGRMIIDPRYGIVAGTKLLFETDGTTVRPSFIGSDGKISKDKDGFPDNANFFLDIQDGNAYFRGNVYATDGTFNGTIYAKDGEFTGTIHATDGDFSGTINASVLNGTLTGGQDGGAITGVSLDIGSGNFTVDSNGNVVIRSGSISWGAVTGTDEIDKRIEDAQDTADSAMDAAEDASGDVAKLAMGTYTPPKSTFIDGTTIKAPTIVGGTVTGGSIYGGGYYNLSGGAKLTLEGNNSYADLNLYSNGGSTSVFGIYDAIDALDMTAYKHTFLTYSQPSSAACPQGKWDFSDATVTGIDISARFG